MITACESVAPAPVADAGIDDPLSPQEQEDFAQLEETLRLGFSQMEKMAAALDEIRRRKLYRGKFRTFELYVQTEWDMCISRAYQLCNVSKVIKNLNLHNCGETPATESQYRELAKLPEPEQPKVWNAVVEAGEPTAERIREVALTVVPKHKTKARRVEVKQAAPTEDFPPFVEDENDILKASRAMIDIWDRTDKSNRLEFLLHVFPRANHVVKAAMETASRRKK